MLAGDASRTASGRAPLCAACSADGGGTLGFPEEIVGLLFGVADILNELRAIRNLLGGGDEEEDE
jgi:hypothetical protein